MRIFYPSAVVRVTALVQLSRTRESTQQVSFLARARTVTIERNDYNTPDTVSLDLDALRFPVLPRLIRQVHVQIYAGDAGSVDSEYDPIVDDQFIRFVGWVDEPELGIAEEDSKISWKARDYTALYIDFKRPSVNIIPSYGDNLEVALRRILDAAPGGEDLKLKLVGQDSWPDLSIAAPPGLDGAKIPVKDDTTAWTLIKYACDPVALIPRIELDTLVVSTSRGLLVPENRPIFMLGANLTEYKEKRNLAFLRVGIGLRAYSLETRREITALFPPEGDRAIKKHLTPATKKEKKPPKTTVTGTEDKRKWFPYGTVSTQAELDDAAERLYNERSRQEFEASFTCRRMVVPGDIETLNADDGSEDFDVTKLTNGERIMLIIESEYRAVLGGLSSTQDRVQFLESQGYDSNVASILVQAFEAGVDGPLEMYVRSAKHTYAEDGYSLQCEVQNLLTLAEPT